MYHLLSIKYLRFFPPECVYGFLMLIRRNTNYFFKGINQVIFYGDAFFFIWVKKLICECQQLRCLLQSVIKVNLFPRLLQLRRRSSSLICICLINYIICVNGGLRIYLLAYIITFCACFESLYTIDILKSLNV
jgi:hypothetical protein